MIVEFKSKGIIICDVKNYTIKTDSEGMTELRLALKDGSQLLFDFDNNEPIETYNNHHIVIKELRDKESGCEFRLRKGETVQNIKKVLHDDLLNSMW